MSALEQLKKKFHDDPNHVTSLEWLIVFLSKRQRLHAATAASELVALHTELEEAKALNNKTMCAYCGFVHEDKTDIVAIANHIMTCEKRPEQTILKKAFEVEDRLYQRIIHLTLDGYNPDDCESCKEITDLLRVYNEVGAK